MPNGGTSSRRWPARHWPDSSRQQRGLPVRTPRGPRSSRAEEQRNITKCSFWFDFPIFSVFSRISGASAGPKRVCHSFLFFRPRCQSGSNSKARFTPPRLDGSLINEDISPERQPYCIADIPIRRSTDLFSRACTRLRSPFFGVLCGTTGPLYRCRRCRRGSTSSGGLSQGTRNWYM